MAYSSMTHYFSVLAAELEQRCTLFLQYEDVTSFSCILSYFLLICVQHWEGSSAAHTRKYNARDIFSQFSSNKGGSTAHH